MNNHRRSNRGRRRSAASRTRLEWVMNPFTGEKGWHEVRVPREARRCAGREKSVRRSAQKAVRQAGALEIQNEVLDLQQETGFYELATDLSRDSWRQNPAFNRWEEFLAWHDPLLEELRFQRELRDFEVDLYERLRLEDELARGDWDEDWEDAPLSEMDPEWKEVWLNSLDYDENEDWSWESRWHWLDELVEYEEDQQDQEFWRDPPVLFMYADAMRLDRFRNQERLRAMRRWEKE